MTDIIESKEKRAFIFFDGQNLYHTVKEAFGYNYPNYDIKLLSDKICLDNGWKLSGMHFYTGTPDPQDNSRWNSFWTKKLSYMGRLGIKIFSRSLKYHNETFRCPDCGRSHTSLIGHEKGVDVRIALDIIKFAHEKLYDVAVIFSQDQDLTEAVDEVKRIAHEQKRWITIASAFPVSPTYNNKRGIDKTDWIKIDKKTYDTCIDLTDYRN